MEWQFEVLGKPQGKGRPRITTRGKFAHAYTPKRTVEYEEHVRQSFLKEYPVALVTEKPLQLNIHCYFEPPSSFNRVQKVNAVFGTIRHTSKPDIDNVIKSVTDALTGILYKDDSQIIRLFAVKEYRTVAKVVVEVVEV